MGKDLLDKCYYKYSHKIKFKVNVFICIIQKGDIKKHTKL